MPSFYDYLSLHALLFLPSCWPFIVSSCITIPGYHIPWVLLFFHHLLLKWRCCSWCGSQIWLTNKIFKILGSSTTPQAHSFGDPPFFLNYLELLTLHLLHDFSISSLKVNVVLIRKWLLLIKRLVLSFHSNALVFICIECGELTNGYFKLILPWNALIFWEEHSFGPCIFWQWFLLESPMVYQSSYPDMNIVHDWASLDFRMLFFKGPQ